MKPMLAEDWVESKVQLPCIIQPKIDGVRGMNILGRHTGRSLKAHGNVFHTEQFSHPMFHGLDGELAFGAANDPCLCRATSSVLARKTGEPAIDWWLFDLITDKTVNLPYTERFNALMVHFDHLLSHAQYNPTINRLRLIPSQVVNTLDELLEIKAAHLDAGFEGSILRKPDGLYKMGRSTVKEGGLLRIKDFVEEEGVVISVEEGQTNNNEAKVNELGRTERSTHQENMVNSGVIGNMQVKLFSTGQVGTFSAGALTAAERKAMFEDQSLIVGHTVKVRHFPKGVKDKPRFGTYVCHRSASDMS